MYKLYLSPCFRLLYLIYYILVLELYYSNTLTNNKFKSLANNLDLRLYSILPGLRRVCGSVRPRSSAKSIRNKRPNFSVASGYVRDKIILLAEGLAFHAMIQGHFLDLVVL